MNMINNKISTLGVLGLGIFSVLGLKAQESKKMNVLFIAVDDLKPTIAAFGDSLAITPNIDRLAQRGAMFSNCYTQQAISGATRASIMTGMRPDKTKVWDLVTDFRQVNPNTLTISEHFIKNGYEAVARGKIYHIGSSTPQHDAQSWSMPYLNPKAPVYAKYVPKPGERGPATEFEDVPDDTFVDGKTAKEGVKLLAQLSKNDKPFFLALGFIRPHLPFVAPKRYWDMYDKTTFELAPYQQKATNSPDVAYHNAGELKNYTDIPKFDNYSDDELKKLPKDKQLELIRGYYAAASYTDAQIGMVLDQLDRLGLAESTIIVLWGDHGWHLGDHGLWCKHTDFENSTRVPLIIASPKLPKGVDAQTQSEFVDVFPTMCDLAGIPIPKHLDGISLKESFTKPDAELRQYAMSQYPRAGGIMGYTIRTKRYRYTEWMGSMYDARLPYESKLTIAAEMYDYERDPLETRSLIGDKEYKKEQAMMEKMFREAMQREHNQYISYEKIADYQKPIKTNSIKQGRLDNAGVE